MITYFKPTFIIIALCSLNFTTTYDDGCNIRNTAFKADEEIKMKVFYSTLGMYVGAGEAIFTSALERYNGKPVYHLTGTGSTYSFFDGFFKVRDKYESFIDTTDLLPYKFLRNIDEGGYKKYNNVTFNHTANTAVSTNGVFKVTDCIQDVVSMVYYCRNINFDKYKVDDKILFDILTHKIFC